MEISFSKVFFSPSAVLGCSGYLIHQQNLRYWIWSASSCAQHVWITLHGIAHFTHLISAEERDGPRGEAQRRLPGVRRINKYTNTHSLGRAGILGADWQNLAEGGKKRRSSLFACWLAGFCTSGLRDRTLSIRWLSANQVRITNSACTTFSLILLRVVWIVTSGTAPNSSPATSSPVFSARERAALLPNYSSGQD